MKKKPSHPVFKVGQEIIYKGQSGIVSRKKINGVFYILVNGVEKFVNAYQVKSKNPKK